MKQLLLLRHGEAGFLESKDFDRSLSKSGFLGIQKVVEELVTRDMRLDFTLCSPARRTCQTLELIQKHLAIKECIFDEEIYSGGQEALIKIVHKIPFLVNSCILIGHNPALSSLLSTLTGGEFLTMQPGMLVELSILVPDWNMVGRGAAILSKVSG